MNLVKYEYTIPQWAVCAIEYGDLSGIEPDDVASLDQFMDTLPRRIFSIEYGYETYFTPSNDVHNLGDDCVDMTVYIEERHNKQ